MRKISRTSARKDVRTKDKRSSTSVLLPLYSSPVSAGFPTPANDEITEAIDLNTYLIRNKPASYLLRVQGDSLIGIGILSNDIVVVDASIAPRSGKIVVASVDGEFVIKRFSKEKNGLYLKSENPNYSPIRLTEEMDGNIVGVVVGVVRKL